MRRRDRPRLPGGHPRTPRWSSQRRRVAANTRLARCATGPASCCRTSAIAAFHGPSAQVGYGCITAARSRARRPRRAAKGELGEHLPGPGADHRGADDPAAPVEDQPGEAGRAALRDGAVDLVVTPGTGRRAGRAAGQADGRDLRGGVGDPWDGATSAARRSPAPRWPRRSSTVHPRDMGELRVPGDVPGGPDPRVGGAQVRVDDDEAAVVDRGTPAASRSEPARVGAAADATSTASAVVRARRAGPRRPAPSTAATGGPVSTVAPSSVSALGHEPGQRPGPRRAGAALPPRRPRPAAEPGERLAELAADGAATQHDEPGGQLVEVPDRVTGQRRGAGEPGHGRDRRVGDPVATSACRNRTAVPSTAAVAGPVNARCRRRVASRRHAGRPGESTGSIVAIAPRTCAMTPAKSTRTPSTRTPSRPPAAGVGGRRRGREQRLARHAARPQAVPARAVALHHQHRGPERRGGARADQARRCRRRRRAGPTIPVGSCGRALARPEAAVIGIRPGRGGRRHRQQDGAARRSRPGRARRAARTPGPGCRSRVPIA